MKYGSKVKKSLKNSTNNFKLVSRAEKFAFEKPQKVSIEYGTYLVINKYLVLDKQW